MIVLLPAFLILAAYLAWDLRREHRRLITDVQRHETAIRAGLLVLLADLEHDWDQWETEVTQ